MKKVIISKKGLLAMVKGTYPDSGIIKHPALEKVGKLSGTPPLWVWNDKDLRKLDEKQLCALYEIVAKDKITPIPDIKKDGSIDPLTPDEIEKAADDFANSVVFNLELSHGKYNIMKGKAKDFHPMIKVAFWRGEEFFESYLYSGNKTVKRPTTALKIARPGDKIH